MTWYLALSIFLNILFGFFLVLLLVFKNKKSISFENAFCILNSAIEINRKPFQRGLMTLQKKFQMLSNDGELKQPNESITEYSKKKKELKTAIAKKVMRSISKHTRETILNYYSPSGLVQYVVTELDKEGNNS